MTVAGIAVGVAAVVALSAMGEGFIHSYDVMLTSSGADLILTQKDSADIILASVDESVGPQVAGMSSVKQIAGTMLGIVATPEMPYFFVMGLEPDGFAIKHYKLSDGEPLSKPHEMLLGRAAAKNSKTKTGEHYKIGDASFHVAGVYETGNNAEEFGAVISLEDAQDLFDKPRQVSYYQIKLKRPELTQSLISELEDRYPKLTASRSADYMDNQQETQMLRAMGWFIGLLAVFAGGLGMMNTMLMSVFERTREIGVLRALGWRKRRVLFLILGEAFVLCIVGGLLGNALGVAMVQGVSQIPAVGGLLENAYSPAIFVQSMVIALCLGAAAGVYPAWRAASLQPVEAMRYDGSSGKSQVQAPRIGGMALRNILRQRTRMLLTTLGIGLGVGLVVMLGGMADGLVKQLSDMGSKSGELTIGEAKASDMSLAKVDERIGRWAASLPAVEAVSGFLLGVGSVPGTSYFIILGLDPNSYAIRHFAITDGGALQTARDILLGKVAAKNLKKQVGDSIRISGSSYRIVGIYETGTGYEDGGGLVTLKEAQRLLGRPDQVSWFYVKLRDTDAADAVRRQIETRFPEASVSRASEFAEKTNDMKTFRNMTNALSLISVLVGGIGIMNAMLMSVTERTREIGTLRALGWRRRRVVGMILSESFILSFISGSVGIALGVGLGELLTLEPTMGAFLKGSYTLQLLVQAMLIAIILGAIGALYPAWRAANLSPIEALRYE